MSLDAQYLMPHALCLCEAARLSTSAKALSQMPRVMIRRLKAEVSFLLSMSAREHAIFQILRENGALFQGCVSLLTHA